MSHSLDHVFLITTEAEFWFLDKYHIFSQLLAVGIMLNFVKTFESRVFLLCCQVMFLPGLHVELLLAVYHD